MNNLIAKMSTLTTNNNPNSTEMLEDQLETQLSELNLETESKYVLDQSLVVENAVYVTSIRLNFYQVWCIFTTLPVVYENGKSGYLREGTRFYEYKIQGPSAIFTVYAWNTKGTFMQETKWYIGTTAKDSHAIKAFLEHMYNALECYSLFYKGIERHIFESENPQANKELKLIKQTLIDNRELLKTL